jgi:hypothetical protein
MLYIKVIEDGIARLVEDVLKLLDGLSILACERDCNVPGIAGAPKAYRLANFVEVCEC